MAGWLLEARLHFLRDGRGTLAIAESFASWHVEVPAWRRLSRAVFPRPPGMRLSGAKSWACFQSRETAGVPANSLSVGGQLFEFITSGTSPVLK